MCMKDKGGQSMRVNERERERVCEKERERVPGYNYNKLFSTV